MGDRTIVVKPQAPEVESPDEIRAKIESCWDLNEYEFTGDLTTQAKKRRAVVAFAVLGLVTDACFNTPISRKTWYLWCENDPEFKRAAEDAEVFAIESLERVAIGRGKAVSDYLLGFLLKGGKPGKFKDKIEHSGPNGQPLPAALTNVNVSPVLILPDNHRSDPTPILPTPEKPHEPN